MVVLIAALTGLAGWCFYLQCLRHSYYAERSLKQQRARIRQSAPRGPIQDCRGRVLAASKCQWAVFAEPRLIGDVKDTAERLSPIIHKSGPQICKIIMEARNPGYVQIRSDLTYAQAIAAARIRGIGSEQQWIRYYPMGRLCAHVVGFTSTDGTGLAGLELAYDRQLTGPTLQQLFLADVRRRPLRPIDGQDRLFMADDLVGAGLVVTIDAAIQQFAREALLEQFQAYQASWAVAVVADPKTGGILAMVSLPDFDPNQPGSADPNVLCNHAILDQFEPGSVIKPIAAAIALDNGLIRPDEQIDCEDGVYRGKGFGVITEYSNNRFGMMDLKEIIAQSSNIGMAKLGQRCGPEVMYRGLRLFGFGQPSGIGLPGEANGMLRPPAQWTGYSITRVPFGQEMAVTAMQLVKAFCILANYGRLVRPHLVRAIVEPSGNIRVREDSLHQAAKVGYIIKPDVARWLVREAMVAVVEDGTGKPARLDNWQVFGKTGTAQVARQDGRGYEEGAYVASFVGGAPAEDPAIIVLVAIFRPNVKLGKGYTGGKVASPVAGRIIQKTLPYLESRGWKIPNRIRVDQHRPM